METLQEQFAQEIAAVHTVWRALRSPAREEIANSAWELGENNVSCLEKTYEEIAEMIAVEGWEDPGLLFETGLATRIYYSGAHLLGIYLLKRRQFETPAAERRDVDFWLSIECQTLILFTTRMLSTYSLVDRSHPAVTERYIRFLEFVDGGFLPADDNDRAEVRKLLQLLPGGRSPS